MSAPAAKALSEPVGVEAGHGVGKLPDQRAIERIERLRTIEPDETDPPAGLDDDIVVAHGRFSPGYFWHIGQ